MATTNNNPDTTDASVSAPAIVPPRVLTQQRRRRHSRPDGNRTLEILAILALYVVVIHYTLKFVSFLLPDDSPSREDMLGLRGATGVLGFSPQAPLFSKTSSSAMEFNGNSKYHCCQRDEIKQIKPPSMFHRQVKSVTAVRLSSQALQEDTNNTQKSEKSEMKVKIDNSKEKPKHKRQRIPILSYRDNYVIVSKPTSMTMHHNGNTRWGRSKSPVLENTIHKQLSRRPYLVHRLDHRTSGACIMGFDSKVAGELHGRLRSDGAKKLYVALVRGDLREKFQQAAAEGVSSDGVDLSVNGDGSIIGTRGSVPDVATPERAEHLYPSADKSLSGSEYNGRITVNLPMKVNDIMKEAQTDFYFLSSMDLEDNDDDDDDGVTSTNAESNDNSAKTPYTSKSLSLLLCHPRTGRTHQIRRHVRKALQSPVIGDGEHGDSRVNRFWRQNVGLDRLGLHCWYLELPPIISSQSMTPTTFQSDEDGQENDDDDDHDDDHDNGDDNGECIQCIAPLTTDFAEALHHEVLQPLWEEATSVEPRLKMEPYDERGGTFGRNFRKKKE